MFSLNAVGSTPPKLTASGQSPPTAKLSNTFYFTFLLPDKLNQNVRKVLPSNIDEARQIIRKIELDTKQRIEDNKW